jgi:hypothetical protein
MLVLTDKMGTAASHRGRITHIPKQTVLGVVFTHCAPICQIAPQTRFGELNTSIDQSTIFSTGESNQAE